MNGEFEPERPPSFRVSTKSLREVRNAGIIPATMPVNSAAGHLFGYRASLMPGLSLEALVKIKSDDSAVNLLETLSKQSQASKKLFGRHTDGRLFPMSVANHRFVCSLTNT